MPSAERDKRASDYGWPLTEGQLERLLHERGAEAGFVGQSYIRWRRTNDLDYDGVPACAILIARWWPEGTWRTNSKGPLEVFINLVPREALAATRKDLAESALPDLATWINDAGQALEGWKALRHGRAWLWDQETMRPFDFVPKARG